MSRILAIGLVGLALTAGGAAAQTLPPSWPSLISDRVAARAGDSLTVVIYESAQASNSAQRGSRKSTSLAAEAAADRDVHQAQGSLSGTFDGLGQTSRSDKLVASISVVIRDVLPNGDLRVEGEQLLMVNGERTRISVSGRVRPADVSETNTVLSTRLADARIDYDGSGFGARSARPGVLTRALNRLGLF